MKTRLRDAPSCRAKVVGKAHPEVDERVLEAVELVGRLIEKLADNFSEQADYPARYGDSVRRARSVPGFKLDLPVVAYFCQEALKVNEVSHILLKSFSDRLNAAGAIPRRQRTLPLPVDIDELLKGIRWPAEIERIEADEVVVMKTRPGHDGG